MSLATDEAMRGPVSNGGQHGPDRHVSIPDPSSATTQMILREIGAMKELIEANKGARNNEMLAMGELISQRINAVEESIKLAHENEARWPTTLDREITALKEFFGVLLDTHNEKFISVNRRFEERDIRHADNLKESQVAISAAFKAASDASSIQRIAADTAVSKSENAFTKQIESAQLALITAKAEMDKRMDDLKDRSNRIDQQITGILAAQIGRKEQTVEKNDNTHVIYGAIGLVLGLGGLVAAFLARTAS